MELINNLKFSTKLLVMLVFPVLGLLFFSITNVMDKRVESNEMENLNELAKLSQVISSVVHETQKERGRTAGFIGSNGAKMESELRSQAQSSDAKIRALNNILAGLDIKKFGQEFENLLSAARKDLDIIGSKRDATLSQSIESDKALGYYTAMHPKFFDVITYISNLSSNASINKNFSAFLNILQMKEQSGLERAILSSVFAEDRFGEGQFKKYSSLVASQVTYEQLFLGSADKSFKELYNNRMDTDEVKSVAAMRDVAFAKSTKGNFGIDTNDWFQQISQKINSLKEIEDSISGELIASSNLLQEESGKALMYYIVSTVVIIFLTALFAFLIARAILNQLQLLTEKLGAVSNGDLTVRVDTTSRDEVGIALGGVKSMIAKLNEIIGTVISVSESIASASTQMSASSQQMSDGASDQASSAEEVSSSMEEMAANTEQNTKNSKETEQIAELASQNISSSNESVGRTVDSMKLITDKISIIGEIARQTNLLALNAAVEAARAGEHGRGFAVVAAEIRRLAERSQVAASEIDDVSSKGVSMAEESGKLLEEIVPEIQKTSKLIGEIASASIEQNDGTEQVNNAIQQLNNVVQQNASTAEEMAANSEELNAQASQLRETVGFFKVDLSSVGTLNYAPTKAARPSTNEHSNGNGAHKGIDLDLGEPEVVSDSDFKEF
ncbi:MAG: methyl-accepting chemotaxis protein [Cytophagales bacterium]|nr:methyl-accepting chemotaxis protein [Cytophagales bacterium]